MKVINKEEAVRLVKDGAMVAALDQSQLASHSPMRIRHRPRPQKQRARA